jgi:hypothetical protein
MIMMYPLEAYAPYKEHKKGAILRSGP